MRGCCDPAALALPRSLHPLPTDFAYSLFILNGCLQRLGIRAGPLYHRWFERWLATGLSTPDDLHRWLRAQEDAPAFRPRLFAEALKQAETWYRLEVRAVLLQPLPAPSSDPVRHCPRILFGMQGDPTEQRTWVAFFNSRKNKLIRPTDEWLVIFRKLFPGVASRAPGIASSLGTVFYDMVTTCAREADLPLLLLVPAALEKIIHRGVSPAFPRNCRSEWLLTCHSRAMGCPKATRMVCRDRLLATLADCHYILEIRSQGNLLTILREQQQNQPRPQQIHVPVRKTGQNAGNFQLLEEFPQWSRVMELHPPVQAALSTPPAAVPGRRGEESLPAIAWQEYLYHYTRSCPGPWPGQSYRDYLLCLFHDKPLAAHTTLDTLIRILREARIRASCRLVRGNRPVISWSARSPLELQELRKWNRALIRWTFEPYGVAVRHRVLRQHGAQPAIYTTDDNYRRLNLRHRFRFQRHEPSRSAIWKFEHEWRLPGDFSLQSLTPADGFIFVPDAASRQTVAQHVKCTLPIIVLQSVGIQAP